MNIQNHLLCFLSCSLIMLLISSSLSAQTSRPVKAYTGQYTSDNIGQITISADGEGLLLEAGSMRINIQPANDHTFVYPERHLSFEFKEDAKGVIDRMIVIENGKAVDEAQKTSSESVSLTEEILQMDSVLFAAFNAQDLETLKNMFTEDLEFFHDKGGLSDYEKGMAAFKSQFSQDYKLERTLEEGSAKVYSVPGYGAMMTGRHEFCHEENGKQDCGTFSFLHVWQKSDEGWKVSRVMSYDH